MLQRQDFKYSYEKVQKTLVYNILDDPSNAINNTLYQLKKVYIKLVDSFLFAKNIRLTYMSIDPENIKYLVKNINNDDEVNSLSLRGVAFVFEQMGIQGIATGPPGIGDDGPTGAQGNTGAMGINGLPGAQGIMGPSGAQGATGSTGPDATPGNQGAQGATGDTGPNGADSVVIGPPGNQGPTGSTGPIGPTGPKGPGAATWLELNNTPGNFIANRLVTINSGETGVTHENTRAIMGSFVTTPGNPFSANSRGAILSLSGSADNDIISGTGLNVIIASSRPTNSVNTPVPMNCDEGLTLSCSGRWVNQGKGNSSLIGCIGGAGGLGIYQSAVNNTIIRGQAFYNPCKIGYNTPTNGYTYNNVLLAAQSGASIYDRNQFCSMIGSGYYSKMISNGSTTDLNEFNCLIANGRTITSYATSSNNDPVKHCIAIANYISGGYTYLNGQYCSIGTSNTVNIKASTTPVVGSCIFSSNLSSTISNSYSSIFSSINCTISENIGVTGSNHHIILGSEDSTIDPGSSDSGYLSIISSKESNITSGIPNHFIKNCSVISSNGDINAISCYYSLISSSGGNSSIYAGRNNSIVGSGSACYIADFRQSYIGASSSSSLKGFFVGTPLNDLIIASDVCQMSGTLDLPDLSAIISSTSSSINQPHTHGLIFASSGVSQNSTSGKYSHTAHIASGGGTITDANYAAVIGCSYSNNVSNSVRVKYMVATTSTMVSDINMKKNIIKYEPDPNLLNLVLSSKIHQFNFVSQNDGDPFHLGFIAQEILETFPEMIQTKNYKIKKVQQDKTTNQYYYYKGKENIIVDANEVTEENGNLFLTEIEEKYPITIDKNTFHSIMWETVKSLSDLYDDILKEQEEIDNLLGVH